MQNFLFNEKVIKKLSVPEDTDDYLKLPGFGIPAMVVCIVAFALTAFMFEAL